MRSKGPSLVPCIVITTLQRLGYSHKASMFIMPATSFDFKLRTDDPKKSKAIVSCCLPFQPEHIPDEQTSQIFYCDAKNEKLITFSFLSWSNWKSRDRNFSWKWRQTKKWTFQRRIESRELNPGYLKLMLMITFFVLNYVAGFELR